MSTSTEETQSHINNVDVDVSIENSSLCELTSDSGIDNVDTYSPAFPQSSDSDVSPVKNTVSSKLTANQSLNVFTKNESGLSSSPVSISPDDIGVDDNLMSCDDSPSHDTGANTEHIFAKEVCPNVTDNDHCIIDANDTQNNLVANNDNYKLPCTDLNPNSKALATSTTSLNEQKLHNVAITKSPFSRSAENISKVGEIEDKPIIASTNELNSEEILSQFTSKKPKVGATQKIPEIPQSQSLDVRYSRIPKELLSQDLGSIVKNVHGIFSSVSGSLKSAYNNTHRAYPSIQKVPVKNISKTLPNGKVMKEIFEDETEEKLIPNDADKISEVGSHDSNLRIEHGSIEMDGDGKSDETGLQMKLETLERLLGEQRKENIGLRERVKQHFDELQEKDHGFKEMETKLDLMAKRVEHAEREKDAAVMRYASVECQAIEAKRAAEKAALAERAALTEMELLNSKLKSAHSEKQRICQLYDDKCHDLSTSEREVAKVREDLREIEGRLKWTQSKLRVEMDAYKESSERAEKLAQQLTELEASKEAALANSNDSIRAKQLESELKESQAALILCRHEKEELERRLSTTSQQLETCRRERDNATSALTRTTAEVEELKESNMRLEEEAAELAALRAQAALADTLSAQLHRESERAQQAEEALSESRALAETCGRREAAALEHAARVTAQHVAQRAATKQHDAKVQALSADNTCLRERIVTLEAECSKLQAALADETERRNMENRVLARKVAEMTEEVAEVSKQLEWEKGENGVLKKKHASAIKELNRELQRTLKRCEQLETKITTDAPSTRTGSISSLSSGEAPADDRLQNGHAETLPDIQVREPDRQALIERIVSLQRAAARRSERCEFLEEHSRQLTSELRSKSRLLRHLLCTLPADAVASQDRDMNKLSIMAPLRLLVSERGALLTEDCSVLSVEAAMLARNNSSGDLTDSQEHNNSPRNCYLVAVFCEVEKEMARLGGGAMAAVWGGDTGGMTLDLSLEMNKRLQAVLEDTLLKNITLKENMDTLGAEISRLKEQKNTDSK